MSIVSIKNTNHPKTFTTAETMTLKCNSSIPKDQQSYTSHQSRSYRLISPNNRPFKAETKCDTGDKGKQHGFTYELLLTCYNNCFCIIFVFFLIEEKLVEIQTVFNTLSGFDDSKSQRNLVNFDLH